MRRNTPFWLYARLLGFVALLALGSTAWGQRGSGSSQNVDSLQRELAGKKDTAYIRILLDIAYAYYPSKTDSTSAYATRGLELGAKSSNKVYVARAHHLLGLCDDLAGAYDAAVAHYQQAIDTYVAAGKEKDAVVSRVNLASIYIQKGDYPGAIQRMEETLALANRLKDYGSVATLQVNLGLVYAEQGQNEKGLSYWLKTVALLDEHNIKTDFSILYNNIGYVYIELGDFGKSVEYLNLALEKGEQFRNNITLAVTYETLADLYVRINDLEQALKYATKSLDLAKKGGFLLEEVSGLIRLGKIYEVGGAYDRSEALYKDALKLCDANELVLEKGLTLVGLGHLALLKKQYTNAIQLLLGAKKIYESLGEVQELGRIHAYLAEAYLALGQQLQALAAAKESLSLAQQAQDKQVKQAAHRALANCYESLGQQGESLTHLKAYVSLTDSVTDIAGIRRVAALRAEKVIEEREAYIAMLQEQRTLQQRSATLQRWAIALLAISSLLALSFGYVWWRGNKRKALHNQELVQKNEEISHKGEELLMQSNALNQSNEELRATLDQLQAAQQQLVTSEKRAALGTLVASIAHEINSPISAVRSTSQRSAVILPEIIATFPTLFDGLEQEVRTAFLWLVETSVQNQRVLSTKEERLLRQQFEEQLTGAGVVKNTQELADFLVRMGIVGDVTPAMALLRSPKSLEIAAQALKLTALQRNNQLIEQAVERTTRIITALRKFGRETTDVKEKRPIQLEETLETVLILYQSHINQQVRLEKHFYDTGLTILAFPNELEHVWSNLIHNSLLAMGTMPEGLLTLTTRVQDGFAEVIVEDTGPGIAPEVQARIFEPFFTTRSEGEGTGLGLDIAKRIVDEHNGTIQVVSKPGHTVFTVRLPLA